MVFIGPEPSISLSVFGSDAYVHTSDTMGTKFDSRSKKCKFLGYNINYGILKLNRVYF